MGMEEFSRAREQELHGLRLDLKGQIVSAPPGTPCHAALVQQLEALDLDNDDAQMRWFKDLTRDPAWQPTSVAMVDVGPDIHGDSGNRRRQTLLSSIVQKVSGQLTTGHR